MLLGADEANFIAQLRERFEVRLLLPRLARPTPDISGFVCPSPIPPAEAVPNLLLWAPRKCQLPIFTPPEDGTGFCIDHVFSQVLVLRRSLVWGDLLTLGSILGRGWFLGHELERESPTAVAIASRTTFWSWINAVQEVARYGAYQYEDNIHIWPEAAKALKSGLKRGSYFQPVRRRAFPLRGPVPERPTGTLRPINLNVSPEDLDFRDLMRIKNALSCPVHPRTRRAQLGVEADRASRPDSLTLTLGIFMKYVDGSPVCLGDVVSVPIPKGSAKARVVMLGETYDTWTSIRSF